MTLLTPEDWRPKLELAFLEIRDISLRVRENEEPNPQRVHIVAPVKKESAGSRYRSGAPPGTFTDRELVKQPQSILNIEDDRDSRVRPIRFVDGRSTKLDTPRREAIRWSRSRSTSARADRGQVVRYRLRSRSPERQSAPQLRRRVLPATETTAIIRQSKATIPQYVERGQSNALVLYSRRDSHLASRLSNAEHQNALSLEMAKVVNDASLHKKTNRNYWPTLYEDDSDTSSQGQMKIDRYSQPKTDNITAQAKEERLKALKRDPQAGQNLADDPEVLVTPFLTWGVSQSIPDAQNSETSLTACIRLLRKLDKALTERSLYRESYRCTLTDLIGRHEILRRNFSGLPVDDQEALAQEPLNPTANQVASSSIDSFQQNAQHRPQFVARSNRTSPQDSSTEALNEVSELIMNIFSLSRSIMRLFVPLQAGAVGDVEWIMDRYWGALDQIFRVGYPSPGASSTRITKY